MCTVPIELNNYLNDLLSIAEKYGFISARLLVQEMKWTPHDFQSRTLDLRNKGIVWVDKKVPNEPHYYFLTHLGIDFTKFSPFMHKY